MVFLSTIWHSGTHSLKLAIEKGCMPQIQGETDIYWQHCDDDAVTKCQLPIYRWIATTIRDPYSVAASWGNRGRFEVLDFQIERTWFEQWDAWGVIAKQEKAKIFQMPVGEHHGLKIGAGENTAGDVYGLHEALRKGDMETYHKYVPKECIEHAQRIISTVGFQRADL